jgi:hypothetical protein
LKNFNGKYIIVEPELGGAPAVSWIIPEFLEIFEIFAIIFFWGIYVGFSGWGRAILDSPSSKP